MSQPPATPSSHLSERVADLMPQLTEDLKELIAIPSVSVAGYPEATRPALAQAQQLVERLFREAGVLQLEAIELPDTAPVLFGEIPAPPGAPTVLMYSHYDVVPAGDETLWDTPPFEPTERDGAIYGRGAADTKSNILSLVGALRAWDGHPPVGVKVVIEGQEEVGGGAFTTYPKDNPDRFASDVMIIADMGNVRPGVPTLTVGLRGMADVVVEVRTLGSAKHSGLYGGAAPDALLALVRALASLHDDAGDVAVAGLRRDDSIGAGPDEQELRRLAEVVDGVPLIGTGSLGSRVWSGPAITVTGIDVPSVDTALNAVAPHARAKLNVRVHPEQDPAQAQEAVLAHLRAAMPFGIALDAQPMATGAGFAARTDNPTYAAARAAWSQAWDAQTVLAGAGGSIPVVNSLAAGAPEADVLLIGTADGYANIHGPNERVIIDEFARSTLAIADLLGRLAGAAREEQSP